MSTPTIVIDNRERGKVRDAFYALPCKLQLEQLQVADYVIGPDFGIERKRGDDLAGSLCDNRFFTQMYELKKYYPTAVILLEKPWLAFMRKGIYDASIYGALLYASFKMGIPVIPSQSEEQTGQIIYSFAKALQLPKKEPFHFKPIARAPKEIRREDQQNILEGLWKVGEKKARTLLDHFRSPANVFESICSDIRVKKKDGSKLKHPKLTGELKDLKGFGPKFALNNKRLLELPFSASKNLPVEFLTK